MTDNAQPSLSLYIIGNRTFAGKLGRDEGAHMVLDDAVEFLTIVQGNGSVGVVPIVLGTICVNATLGILAEMSKDSIYYRPYYQVVSGLKLA